MKLFDSSTAQN